MKKEGEIAMKIKIFDLEFEVVEKESITHCGGEIGLIDHLEQKIYILSSLSEERKKIVLLHETLHSIFQQLGFDKEHDDERLISSVATALYQVFQDNKAIFS